MNVNSQASSSPAAAEPRKKALFYTHTARAFRATLIGFLSELSRDYDVTLLAEDLDDATRRVLDEKEYFPGLRRIIPVGQFSAGEGPLAKNLRLRRLAERAVAECGPSVVLAGSDMHTLFELYLLRAAKKAGAAAVCIQPTVMIENLKTSALIDRTNAELRFPAFLPLWLKLGLVKARKYAGHLLNYWALPLLAGAAPFPGASSFALRRGNSGLRDADAQVVLSGRDLEAWLADGVPAEKLFVVAHPLRRGALALFSALGGGAAAEPAGRTALLLLPADRIGVRPGDLSIIPAADRTETWTWIAAEARRLLPGWRIIVKPHPDAAGFEGLRAFCASLSPAVEFAGPAEPVERYLAGSSVIVDLPRSASTVLWTAALQYPGRTLISVDFDRELCGDAFRDLDGVLYAASREEFSGLLAAAAAGRPPAGPDTAGAARRGPRARTGLTEVIKEVSHVH